MSVAVFPPSRAWQAAFADEAAVLDAHLGPWLTGPVEHIGSTAVPGLPAKPIVDMLAPVADLAAARDAIPVLERLGYRHADHRPQEALWFYRQPGDDYATRTHQVHLTTHGSDLWRERVAFRDALRADTRLRDDYAALKNRLATGAGLPEYTAGKREFVAAVLRAQGISLHRAPGR